MADFRAELQALVNAYDKHGGRWPQEDEIALCGAVECARVALSTLPPAPAADTTIDLDALLSPEGAYKPGTGHEDGAQLVDHLEWWAPVYGGATLDTLLDQIRARILPHLRPPIAGIDVPGPDGDYGGLQELCEAEGVDPRVGVPLLKRAKNAWKVADQPHPAADGEVGESQFVKPTDQQLLEMACSREPWATWLQAGGCLESAHWELVDLLRAVLAHWGRSTPQPPALLERLAPPHPIPVSERSDDRDPVCVAVWPDCVDGGYDPRCCRFPKSCSCNIIVNALPPPSGEVEA